jgi:hypothetical protein
MCSETVGQRSVPPTRRVGRVSVLLLGAAVIVGLVRSILDTYFTTRQVELPPPPAATWPALSKRVAMFVLDGLRPMEAFSPDYMPLLSERRSQAAWGIARAGEITMTVPGVRMLGAGVSSDFLEILHNWTPRASPAPSIFRMAKTKGLQTVLVGDHVWKRAFGDDIDRHLDTRLDAWTYYRDPVRAPDESHMEDLHAMLAANDPFELLVIHFVGPDHASHRSRVTSARYREYAHWLDPKLDELLNAFVAAGVTILVTSDHGMSDWGQHGGDEPTARKTPYLFQGSGIKIGPGPRLEQADLPATLAALLSIPMPPFGEGRVAHEVLDAPAETVLAAMNASLAQARTYLRGCEAKYGNVPRALLDEVPDLARLSSEQGLDGALAQANRYFEAYHDQRRSVTKSVGRTWAWLATILLFAVLVLLPDRRSPLPRGASLIAGCALVLSAASCASTDVLWPAVLATLVASIWIGQESLVGHCRTFAGVLTGLATAGGIVGLLALAHVGFNRQFRSDMMFTGISDPWVRVASYGAVILAGGLFVLWGRRQARVSSSWPRQAWTGLAVLFLFLTMLPSGKLLLLVSPGLGIGVLWMHRLARLREDGMAMRPTALLESDWFLFLATLAWVLVESWFGAVAALVDQDRGLLGWALNRLPWLLAPALVYQQFVLGRREQLRLGRTTTALSTLSVLLTLPPLLLAHHTTEHSNFLVGSAIAAMLLAAVNRRSPVATHQLGAAIYALTILFGSSSYALLCFVLIGSYWAFVLAPVRGSRTTGDEERSAPILAALGACLVWLTVHRFRDGSFSFSDIEVTVAFYGNATHTLGQGAVQVAARFILPMVLLLIPLRQISAPLRTLGGILAVWLIHIGFLLIGFLATQSQFYTPYRLAGELAHFIALLGAIPILFLVFAASRPGSPVSVSAVGPDG